jgi:hypothetical protein
MVYQLSFARNSAFTKIRAAVGDIIAKRGLIPPVKAALSLEAN